MSIYAENVAAWLKRTYRAVMCREMHRQYRDVYRKYPEVIRDLANYAEIYSGTGYAETEREAAILEGRQQVVRHLIALGSASPTEVIKFLEDHSPEDMETN